MSRTFLRATLTVLGVVATAAGAKGMLRGASEVVDAGAVVPSVDSEYRFYATWYHVAGVVLLRSARRPESATIVVRTVSAGLVGAGLARALSLRTVGSPHRLQRLLMGVELGLPAIIVPWQARVARRHAGGGPAGRS